MRRPFHRPPGRHHFDCRRHYAVRHSGLSSAAGRPPPQVDFPRLAPAAGRLAGKPFTFRRCDAVERSWDHCRRQ
ncbi:hypothetical protein KCP78_09865 [Salmonella enterica subsp. enterica]|nr:hypothetical protein KCP78_09865 [Salmonella enterica subsp. enterica]